MSGVHNVSQSISGSFNEGEFYTLSYFAKTDGYKYARLRAADNSGYISDVIVDLDAGIIVTGSGGSILTDIGGGWLRFTELVTIRSGGATALTIGMEILGDSAELTFTGDGERGILVAAPQIEKTSRLTSPMFTQSSITIRQAASAKVTMNGATSIDITYSDGSVINVQAVDDYATIPQADSAWGSKYITTIKFNV